MTEQLKCGICRKVIALELYFAIQVVTVFALQRME